MRQKISRPRNPAHSPGNRNRNKNGRGILIGLATAMILGGFLAILKPVPFWSGGGVGRHGSTPVTSVYSTNETVGFGVLFIAIGLFLIRVALEIRKP